MVKLMTEIWFQAALWLGLALVAMLLSIYLRKATALSEIVVGTIPQLFIGALLGATVLAGNSRWIQFLSGAGAILLTFLAGAELDPGVLRKQWTQALFLGLIGFFVPFLLCAAVVYWGFGWTQPASWLTGIAMSTTSIAVVYVVMLDLGFNNSECGKTVLAACFVNDLATVIALGIILAPFTIKTVAFTGVIVAAAFILPWLTPRFFRRFRERPSELETKFLMLCLFGLGGLATWADSKDVLPAYLINMVLAGIVGKDHALIRRRRTLTFGLLTPFSFIRGWFTGLPARFGGSTRSILNVAGSKNVLQNGRSISSESRLWFQCSGGNVYHSFDVYRSDIWDDISVIRFVTQTYQ